MDSEALIASLWNAGEEKIRSVEAAAEDEIRKIGEEASLKIEAMKEQYRKTLQADSAKRTADILSDAELRSDLIRTAASRLLSDRLYQLARESLPLLRNERGTDVFTALMEELPSLPWKSVRVNPGDIAIAHKNFPGAEIIPDDAISGGMDVVSEDGKVRVINTFEKRLERAWEDMRSELLHEDYESP